MIVLIIKREDRNVAEDKQIILLANKWRAYRTEAT